MANLLAGAGVQWWLAGGPSTGSPGAPPVSTTTSTSRSPGRTTIAPEVQLLFESRADRAVDTVDARAIIPLLSTAARWLAEAVQAAHPASPWLDWL